MFLLETFHVTYWNCIHVINVILLCHVSNPSLYWHTSTCVCVWVCLLKYSMLGPCSCLLTEVLLGVSLDNPTQISKTGFPHGNKNLKHVFIEMFPAHGRFLTLVLYCESNAHKKTYCIPLTRVGKSHRRYPVTAQVSEVCKIGLGEKKTWMWILVKFTSCFQTLCKHIKWKH